MPDIKQIADKLIKLCSEQKFVEAYRELFGEEAESIDPLYPIMPPARGLITLIERERQFLAKAQIHSIIFSEPLISGSYFTVKLTMSFTHADRGEVNMEELCVYQVKGGKIISQQFFIG